MAKLTGYNYEIQFKSGVENVAADYLSCYIERSKILAITYLYFSWLDDFQKDVEKDAWVINKLQSLTLLDPQQALSSKYHIDNGFLEHKSRIILSPNNPWKSRVF